jgi:hypothetical protein
MWRSVTVTPTGPLSWMTAPDLGDRKAEKVHGMQGVMSESRLVFALLAPVCAMGELERCGGYLHRPVNTATDST